MAGRPEKYTISYFPHYTKDSKTMFVIENKYGMEGYGFWFKLLELLCNSKGLFYNCSENGSMDYLIAKTKTPQNKVEDILDTLANLDAIDKDLWKNKIIWCQNLVDNVTDVFKRRVSEIPQKPINVNNNTINDSINTITDNKKPINVTTSGISAPQSKLNKINNTNIAPTKVEAKVNFNFSIRKWENIKTSDMEFWKEIYPACDIEQELKKMAGWLIGNPKKKKSNYIRFINNWLTKTQDRGGTMKGGGGVSGKNPKTI
jgi:hypothetical protein